MQICISLINWILNIFIYLLRKNELPFTETKHGKLVIISLDGFRNDYINKYSTPTLDRIASEGVHTPNGYIATFTTKTFPTHFSIVTGLYQENHGIIDNTFYDIELNETFKRYTNDPKWLKAEPIWVTSIKQNVSSKVLFWPGSEIPFQDILPPGSIPYDPKFPFKQRFQILSNWTKDTNLVMCYFNEPDKSGHKYGTFSNEVKANVEKLDKLIGDFIDSLDEDVNLIILSDHGMVNKSEEALIALDSAINLTQVIITQIGVVTGVIPLIDPYIIYNKLKTLANVKVYLKEDIPVRFRYKNNSRIAAIMIFADEGYRIEKTNKPMKNVAYHGYDNELQSMRPLFYAKGPYFKKGVVIEPFSSVNLYSLFCDILQIKPNPNDGSLHVFDQVKK